MMLQSITDKYGIDSFHLKCIAMLTMLLDHIAQIFFPQIRIFKIVGRMAFPIYAFLIAEGFHYTHDRKKYAVRLGIFGLLSEIPYDVAFTGTLFWWDNQNVMFSLAISVVVLMLCNRTEKKYLKVLYVLAGMGLAWLIRSDFAYMSVATVVCFYYFRDKKNPVLMCLLIAVFNIVIMQGAQVYAVLALIPILLYNGKKGKSSPLIKNTFYFFYPVHLFIFACIKYAIYFWG